MITGLHSPYKKVLKHYHPYLTWEEFERSQPKVGGQINQSEFSTVSEQLLQALSANPGPQASDLKPDTLATVVVCSKNR